MREGPVLAVEDTKSVVIDGERDGITWTEQEREEKKVPLQQTQSMGKERGRKRGFFFMYRKGRAPPPSLHHSFFSCSAPTYMEYSTNAKAKKGRKRGSEEERVKEAITLTWRSRV